MRGCLLTSIHPLPVGVALGKCVEYGYGFAADIAKRVGAKQAKQTVSV